LGAQDTPANSVFRQANKAAAAARQLEKFQEEAGEADEPLKGEPQRKKLF
jgi:hypothetical protein